MHSPAALLARPLSHLQMLLPPGSMRQTADALEAVLPLDHERLRLFLRGRPQQLMRAPGALAATVVAFSRALGMPLYDVAVMVGGEQGHRGLGVGGGGWAG